MDGGELDERPDTNATINHSTRSIKMNSGISTAGRVRRGRYQVRQVVVIVYPKRANGSYPKIIAVGRGYGQRNTKSDGARSDKIPFSSSAPPPWLLITNETFYAPE